MYIQNIFHQIQGGLDRGAALLNRLTSQALKRIGPDATLTARQLYSPDEREKLIYSLMSTLGTGELLGRAVVRLKARQAMLGRVHKFADTKDYKPLRSDWWIPEGLGIFTPEAALAYFTALVPELGVDVRRWKQDLERQAFTVAAATEQTVLDKIRQIIIDGMMKGTPGGAQSVRSVLDQAGMLPSNPQYCLLPGTLIEGAVEVASKANYDGPAVEIETNAGRILRVTINHPVLAASGWKAAGEIQEGDELVCYGNPVESFPLDAVDTTSVFGNPQRRAIHNQQIPARVEDVFQTLLMQSTSSNDIERPVTSLDFHGDAAFFQSKINRVRPNGILHNVGDSNSIQLARQISLMERADITAMTTSHRGGLLCFSCGRMAYSTLGTGKVFKNARLLGRWHRSPSGLMNIGTAADIDARLHHKSQETPGGDVQLYRKLISSFPGVVTTDSVFKVKRIRWAGHIYDLQTKTGFIVSQGIITSNSDMVYRTNVIDAHAVGHDREMQDPDMQETFPAWLYSAAVDKNSRPTHARRNNFLYSCKVPFVLVRGTTANEICNCRCLPIDLDRWDVEDRLKSGQIIRNGPTD